MILWVQAKLLTFLWNLSCHSFAKSFTYMACDMLQVLSSRTHSQCAAREWSKLACKLQNIPSVEVTRSCWNSGYLT